MQHDTVQRRSLVERIFHAVCFEGIATAVLAPTTAWLMQRSVLEMGGLTILLATTAMIWNIIYNALFDRLWPSHLVKRTAKVRAFHALGFEWFYCDRGEHRGVCAERQPVSGIHAGNRFLPVLPAVYHVL
jgi:uncharacterized membrane protein